MYNIMKSYLEKGNYKLSESQKKINKLWIIGQITEAQRDELIAISQQNAISANEVDLVSKLAELERRIKILEEKQPQDEVEEYPDYVVGKWYYSGDKVFYSNKYFECIAPVGQVCTWSPDEYPAYWQEI